MQYLVFEDEKVSGMKPLVDFKPVYGLYTGFRTLAEKLEAGVPEGVRLSWHMREYLASVHRERYPDRMINRIDDDDVLLVNGRLVCDRALSSVMKGAELEPGCALVQNGNLLFARMRRDRLPGVRDGRLPDLFDTRSLLPLLSQSERSGFRILEHVWDVIAFHADAMELDMASLRNGVLDGDIHPSAVVVNPSNTVVAEGAVVKAGAVLDAREGFVYVGSGAVVEPQAVVMNMVYLAPHSRVKAGARVYSNVFVGTAAKVGGEVEDSLVEPFANKQHDGFLGHSYISSWCNLGAGTNTSDLKNNYSSVNLVIDGRSVSTGLQFLGLIMGEHAKCSINSMFNTGTVVGTSANVFGGGFSPKEVLSFTWGSSAEGFQTYLIDKAVETARKVMQRRQVSMSGAYEAMFRFVADGESRRRVSF